MGSSASTPAEIAARAARGHAASVGAAIVDVNLHDDPFAPRGFWVRDRAAAALPTIAARRIAAGRPPVLHPSP